MTQNSAAVIYKDKPYTITAHHPRFKEIVAAIRTRKHAKLLELLDLKEAVKQYSDGGVVIKGGKVTWHGKEVRSSIADRILEHIEQKIDHKPLVRFFQKLQANPVEFVKQDLFGFLENKGIPLTPDGDFLAYKRVKHDWKDFHTGSVLNKPGTVVSLPRSKADSSRKECSSGLHVAALPYARDEYHSGAGRLLLCQVSPKDVVAVPPDYNQQKMRTIRYKVIREYKDVEPIKDAVTKEKFVNTSDKALRRKATRMSDAQLDKFLEKHGYSLLSERTTCVDLAVEIFKKQADAN